MRRAYQAVAIALAVAVVSVLVMFAGTELQRNENIDQTRQTAIQALYEQGWKVTASHPVRGDSMYLFVNVGVCSWPVMVPISSEPARLQDMRFQFDNGKVYDLTAATPEYVREHAVELRMGDCYSNGPVTTEE